MSTLNNILDRQLNRILNPILAGGAIIPPFVGPESIDDLIQYTSSVLSTINTTGDVITNVQPVNGTGIVFNGASSATDSPVVNQDGARGTLNGLPVMDLVGQSRLVGATNLTGMSGSLTIMMVCKVRGTLGSDTAGAMFSANGSNDFQIDANSLSGGTTFNFQVNSTEHTNFNASNAPFDNQWFLYEYVADADANTAETFINGVSQGSVNDFNVNYDNSLAIKVGANRVNSAQCDMSFAELVIYNRALTSEERTNLHNYFIDRWALLDPRQIDQVDAFWDAQNPNIITQVANEVTQLDDLVGSTDLIATTGPEIGFSTLNNLNTLSFMQEYMSFAGYSTGSSLTVFILSRVNSGPINAATDSIFSLDAANDMQMDAGSSSQFSFEMRQTGIASNIISTGGPYQDKFHLYQTKFDFGANTITNLVDVTPDGSVSNYTTPLDASMTLKLSANRGAGATEKIDQEIAEVIIVQKATTTAEDTSIFNYLKGKWNYQFSPLSISSINTWLDCSQVSSITDTGGLVDQIDDLSGNGNHYTETGSARPTTGASTHNYMNVIDFDSVTQQLQATASINSSATIFMVCKVRDTDETFDSIFSGDGTNDFQLDALSTTQFDYQARTTNIHTTFTATGGPYDYNYLIYEYKLDFAANTAELFVNGVSKGSVNDYTTALDSSLVFRIAGNRANNRWTDMSLAELIIYDKATSVTEDSQIVNYLTQKWKILDVRGFAGMDSTWDAQNIRSITESLGAVSGLASTGIGDNLAQATATNQPTTGVTTQNGLNVIDFDGVDNFLEVSGLFFNDPATIFLLVKVNSVNNIDDSIASFAGEVELRANNATQFDFQAHSPTGLHGDITATGGPYGGSFRLFQYKFDESASIVEILVDGNVVGSVGSPADILNEDTFRLGTDLSETNFIGMSLAEAYISVDFTTPEQDREIFNYLKAKWQF